MLSTLARSKSNVQLELDAAAAALMVAQAEQQVVLLQLKMQQLVFSCSSCRMSRPLLLP